MTSLLEANRLGQVIPITIHNYYCIAIRHSNGDVHVDVTISVYLSEILSISSIIYHLSPISRLPTTDWATNLIKEIILDLELAGSGVQVTVELCAVATGGAIGHHRDLTGNGQTSLRTITSGR